MQQHPGPSARPQHPQSLLQLRAPPHEHLRGRHRNLLLAVQERFGAVRGRHQRPFPAASHQRPASLGSQPQPSQMPVGPHQRVLRLQQHPAGITDRHRHIGPIRQPLVEPLGEHCRRAVIDRTVPADHGRHPGCDQRRRERMRCEAVPASSRAGPARAVVPRRQVPGRVRPGRGQARRHEQQPRCGRQQAHQIGGRRQTAPAHLVLHQQNRHPRHPGPNRPVIQPVTRQMHHRHPAQLSQPVRELLRVTGVLDQQIDAALAHRAEDRRLLGLKIQLALTPRRRRHERQAQPEPVKPWALPRRAQPPHHAEPGQLILRQKPAARPGQQLKRSPQHRPALIRRRPRAPHLEHQRPGRPLQHRTELPLLAVQPAVQFPAQFNEHASIRACPHRPHITVGQPSQELHISTLNWPTGPDPLITSQYLKTDAIDNQATHHVPQPPAPTAGTAQSSGSRDRRHRLECKLRSVLAPVHQLSTPGRSPKGLNSDQVAERAGSLSKTLSVAAKYADGARQLSAGARAARRGRSARHPRRNGAFHQ